MKRATNIILALSTAIGSLSAQGKPTTYEPAPDATDTNGGTPIVAESAVSSTSQEQNLVRPLFEPENRFLSLGFGIGFNSLRYDIEIGDRSPMAGGVINVDYNLFFEGKDKRSEKPFGISFGIGAAVYNAKSIINAQYASSVKIPVTYYDGTSSIEDSEYYTTFKDWEERQTTVALETPFGFIYRKHLTGNTTLFAGAGLKFIYPIKTKFRVKNGDYITTGHLESADLDINPNLSQHGYAANYSRPRGTTDTKHFTSGIYFDLDFVHKNINADFFYGIYGTLGLSNISNRDFLEEGEALNNPDYYCGLFKSNAVDAIKLGSIGIKLGVKIPCPRLKDKDHDGILDKYDKCLGTPDSVQVDSCGCPLDTDKDSVPDYLDKCPNTPLGIPVDSVGCPLDSDGDGVADDIDRCPNTPDSVKVNEFGCPIDSDGDGVPDYLDKCPDTPKGKKVDKMGCPLDSDGDGVNDINDKCPDTPEGVKVDLKGCPFDADGDGVPDYIDKCPNIKGSFENFGCPDISPNTKSILEQAKYGIEFESNKSVIKKTSYPILDRIVRVMKNNPTYILHIAGHTDNIGKPEKNLELSQDRAAAVAQYLKSKGIRASRLRNTGFGEKKPVASNDTEEGRAKNRRVEFEIEF